MVLGDFAFDFNRDFRALGPLFSFGAGAVAHFLPRAAFGRRGSFDLRRGAGLLLVSPTACGTDEGYNQIEQLEG